MSEIVIFIITYLIAALIIFRFRLHPKSPALQTIQYISLSLVLFFIITKDSSFDDSQISIESKFIFNNQKITLYNFVPYNVNVLRSFSFKIMHFSNLYQYEARIRGIDISNPLSKYKFTPQLYSDIKNEFSGECHEGNQLFLNPSFNEVTFFHELGHCDLNLSHTTDSQIEEKGFSTAVMHWGTNQNNFLINRKESLDIFFNDKNQPKLGTIKGHFAHSDMLSQIKKLNKLNAEKTSSSR